LTPTGVGNGHPSGHLLVWSRREAMLGWPLYLRIVRPAAHGGPQWSRLLAGTAAHGEKPMQEQVFWQEKAHEGPGFLAGDPRWSSHS